MQNIVFYCLGKLKNNQVSVAKDFNGPNIPKHFIWFRRLFCFPLEKRYFDSVRSILKLMNCGI